MTARRIAAALWLLVAVVAASLHVAGEPLALVLVWFGAGFLMMWGGCTVKVHARERLERSALYRGAAAVAFAVPLAGALLALVPHHDDSADWFAFYFGLVALLQYRALVATGPGAACSARTVSILLWVPMAFPFAFGCRCGFVPPPPHWTKIAVPPLILATQLVGAVASAVALLSFAPREELAEARHRITRARACSP